CHPALRPAGGAAFAVDSGGEERLVVVHEVERRAARGDLEDIVRAIRRAVGDSLELQAWGVVLLLPGGLPRTTSGKVRRRACARAFGEGTLETLVTSVLAAEAGPEEEAAPGTAQDARARLAALEPRRREEALLEGLVDVVARVARIDRGSVDPTLAPAALGVDSLGAVELRSALETAAGAGVTLAEVLDGRSLTGLARLAAERFDGEAGASRAKVLAASPASSAALSEGQRSLWFMQRLDPAGAAYNVGFAARLDSSTDLDAFEEAFRHLVDRHDALRLVIEAPDGEPRRHADSGAPFSPLRHDAAGWDDDELRRRVADTAHRPFDLARGPLVRLESFTGSAGPVAVFVVHHVAVDFWSVMVLADELRVLYEAAQAGRDPTGGRRRELPPPHARYADFVAWQRVLLDGPQGRALAERAGRRLADASPTLDLPTDRPRPAVRIGRGGSVPLHLDVALSAALRDLARRESTTLFTVLVAALGSLLGRYAGQSDVIVGTPTSGRGAAEFENVVGYFSNLVPVRLDLRDDPDLGSVVARARAAVLEALALQDLPFPVLVEQLRIVRDPGRPPLVQAVLALERPQRLGDVGWAPFVCGAAGERRVLGGLGLTPFPLEMRTVPFDLTVLLVDEGGSLEGAIQYDSDLFDRTRIERLATDYGRVLRAFVDEPGRRIGELSLAAAPAGHRPPPRADAAAPAAAPVPAGGDEPIMVEMIAAIWRDTLGLERVGIDETFFDLGGHSLRLARVHAQLCRQLGREVPIVELFAHPTIRALARHLAGEAPASAPVAAGVERARLRRQASQRRSARTEGSAP
ncbi:MAG: condensation domain-containing protein, partial [Candidatus Eisenbacteria bacterium]